MEELGPLDSYIQAIEHIEALLHNSRKLLGTQSVNALPVVALYLRDAETQLRRLQEQVDESS